MKQIVLLSALTIYKDISHFLFSYFTIFLNQNLEYGHHVEKRCNFDDKGSNYIKFLFQDGSCLLSHQEEIIQQ